MKVIISPAKSLDFEKQLPTKLSTKPAFLSEADKINSLLKIKSQKSIGDLMKISEKLAELNWQRNQVFNDNNTKTRAAVFAFNGDVYNGLDAYSFSKEQINTMQNQLFILSGLYGILKPLDVIKPYRLEMGTPLKIDTSKNLYDFWKNNLIKVINYFISITSQDNYF